MNRREFMNLMGVGVLATSLPVAIAACQSDTAEAPVDESTAANDAPSEDGFAPIGTVAELDEAGFIADDRFQGNRVIVTRDPADASALIAVNSVCTHAGCTVDWEEGMFACSCHGSSFNPDGTVAVGPASEPLSLYEATIEGDQVLVKV